MNISIGKRIQTFRKQKGMSQQDLSDYLGITRQAISKWELDQTLPDLETLMKMADLFEISLNELIGVEENSKSISELYDLMQNILNTQQKANKKRDFIQIITIILCVLSLLMNAFEKKDTTPKPQATDEPVLSNTVISNMYEFTTDRFNKLPSSPFISEKSDIQVYYYNLRENTVRLTGTIYLNEYSENTTVTISFEHADEFPSNNHTIERNFSHTKRNEYTLDTEIPLENYNSAYLTIIQEDGRTNFISLDNGIQHNFLYHVLFSHLNLTIPTDENGHLKLDTIIFDPTIYNTYRDNLFWGYWDTPILITLLDEKTGHIYDEFRVNLNEKTVHQLKAPLKENTPISIRFTFEGVPAPFIPMSMSNIGILHYFKELTFGTNFFNNNFFDYETEIPISFTINPTNEEYFISRLPTSFNEETNIYTFK